MAFDFSFSEILKGGVRFSGNNRLCNVETIQWYDIVNVDSKPNMELPRVRANPLCKEFHLTSVYLLIDVSNATEVQWFEVNIES